MHEMALVHNVLDVVLDTAEKNGATEVTAVYLTIGYARDIVEDLMDGLFKYLARGTVAEHADLVMQRVPLEARCNKCGQVFHLDFFDDKTWQCPSCGVVRDYKVVSGMEFYISKIEIAGNAPQAYQEAQAQPAQDRLCAARS